MSFFLLRIEGLKCTDLFLFYFIYFFNECELLKTNWLNDEMVIIVTIVKYIYIYIIVLWCYGDMGAIMPW
ncbi:hypothetical protein F4703DRAFT_1860677 [Phycomyces blakesleeanus]